MSVPAVFDDAVTRAHPSWHSILRAGLAAIAQVEPAYLVDLAHDAYLPTQGRVLAAFAQPLEAVRYVLVGEGPYPRQESATGVCFMDGAVGDLWSLQGLSKPVNRATSLRNFMKMLMVADGLLRPDATGAASVARVAAQALSRNSTFIQTLPELQANLTSQGFLLLNAALVFRPHVPPLKEAQAWKPFFEVVLAALANRTGLTAPSLVLWGKIAVWLNGLPAFAHFPRAVAEHPYNLSFIQNQLMQSLFGPMHLLKR